MKVFKYNKIRIVDGKKVKTPSKRYYGKFKNSNGVWQLACLFTDKASSLFELQKRARQAQQVQAGMVEADVSNGLETSLDEHLESYAEAVKERSQKSASSWSDEKKIKIEKILHQAGVLMPKDVTTTKIKDALGKLAKKNEWSKRTSNQYLIAIKGFFSWMVLENRLPFNPVLTLKAQAVKDADCRRLRRTFTQDEAGALVQFLYASKDQRKVVNTPRVRALLYALAFQTGLRAKELQSINPSNFDLEKAELAIHGRDTKNSVSEIVPLPKVLVSMVATILAEKKTPSNLFKGAYHRGQAGKRLKLDMAHARLDFIESAPTQAERTTRAQSDFLLWENARGEFLDFHSFRSSFITSLVEGGATIKQVQLLARHKDAETTLKHYIKIKDRSELAGVVVDMPALMSTTESENKKVAQEVAQNILVAQEVAQKLEPLGYLESLQESEKENLTILQGVGSSEVKGVLPRKREVRPVGIEPTTLDLGSRTTLESKALETKRDEHFTKSEVAQEVAQNFQDERFAELARAWATLPKSTQLGIIALADIAKANSLDPEQVNTKPCSPSPFGIAKANSLDRGINGIFGI